MLNDFLRNGYILSHSSVPALSQELPFGVSQSAVEINQQYSQTGTVPSIIQLPIMTSSPSKQMIVIPTVNSTVMTAGTTAIPNTIHLSSPIISSNALLGQVKSPQLQLIVVQPSTPLATKPEKINSPIQSISENSISNLDNSSSEIESQNLLNVTNSSNILKELHCDENIKMESRENVLNQQSKLSTKATETVEVQNNIESNERQIMKSQSLEESVNDTSMISTEWNALNNLCNSLADSQHQFCYNNSENSSNKNVTLNSHQESANSTLFHNANNKTQTLRELLLQGRQNISTNSSPSAQITNNSISRKEIISLSENETTQPTLSDFATSSITTNSNIQDSEKLNLITEDKSDFAINNFTFQSTLTEKETNEHSEYSFHNVDNLPSSNEVIYFEKYIHQETNNNLNREFLSNAFNNSSNREETSLFKIDSNNSSNEMSNSILMSSSKVSSSEQSSFQEDDFNIHQRNTITEQERIDIDKKEIKHQEGKSITSEGINNFHDVPNSGSNVDHFSDITMLPEVELLSMINPSTFDNV